jgi:hypothetical protein
VLKQQLIKSVEPMYIRTLENRHTGFANVATHRLIEHLLQTYGNVTQNDLALNDQAFRKPYDPNQPIEALYAQIEDAMDFADAGGGTYTAALILANAYTHSSTTLECSPTPAKNGGASPQPTKLGRILNLT